MRCATCRFWDQEDEGSVMGKPDGWGACTRFQPESGDYDKAFLDRVDPYTGEWFMTAPDFGCVAHETTRDLPIAG